MDTKREFGVFVWNEDTHFYTRENAKRIFKSEKAAEKYAKKLDEGKWPVHVVRWVWID